MQDEFKSIVVVGYPKSGNTWVTRLVAELVGCPVGGFWNQQGEEIAVEGVERESTWKCFKSHHQLNELRGFSEMPSKTIYVYRDPRDVFLSGLHYFYDLDPITSPAFKRTWLGRGINRAYKILIGNRLMRIKMLRALFKGNAEVHHWCRVSWEEHMKPFQQDAGTLKVSYEALLSNPIMECKRILEYVGVERSDELIVQSVERQSFNNSRERFLEQGDRQRADFMRKGQAAQWRANMSPSDQLAFRNQLEERLVELGYDLT